MTDIYSGLTDQLTSADIPYSLEHVRGDSMVIFVRVGAESIISISSSDPLNPGQWNAYFSRSRDDWWSGNSKQEVEEGTPEEIVQVLKEWGAHMLDR